MRRTLALIAALFIATAVQAAEEQKKPEYNTVREYKNQVFEVRNREAKVIASAVTLLGSGFQGSGLSINEQLHTITVRDFPENIAAIGEAIKRLDKPAEETPSVELKISVLMAAKTPIGGTPVPDNLAPAVKELESALRFSHYALLTSVLQRAKVGTGIEQSGVIQPDIAGVPADQARPLTYNFRLRQLSISSIGDKPSVNIDDFNFSMRVPIGIAGNMSYQQIGFNTPVTIRGGETVVLGTTTMGDKALMVVVSATVK